MSLRLYRDLLLLKAQIAHAAQKIYDDWDPDDEFDDYGGGGICDAIADEISSLISAHISYAEIDEGGHDGDDHAWLIVSDPDYNVRYGVDIDPYLYEYGGGYSWHKRPHVRILPSHVEIFEV